jgi:hypothetical protein
VLVDRTPSQQYMRISAARRNVASGFKRSREVGMSGGARVSTDSARGPETTGNNRHQSDDRDT